MVMVMLIGLVKKTQMYKGCCCAVTAGSRKTEAFGFRAFGNSHN